MENKLKQIRKSRGLTQEELGNLVGASKLMIYRLEKGSRQLSQKWLTRISKALNCKITDIIPDNKVEGEFACLSEEEKNLIRTFRKIKEVNKENEISKTG